MGRKQDVLSTSGTLCSHIPPSNSPAFSPVFFPFRASDRQNLYSKSGGSVQNRSFSGGNHYLHRAGERGISGREYGKIRMQFEYFGSKNLPHSGKCLGDEQGEF